MKKGILAALCAGMIVLSGCYGSYGSTKWLHNAIGKISNKWAKSLVHFLATPAYGLCFFFVDFLFVNTIEFWTGPIRLQLAIPTMKRMPRATPLLL